MRQQLAMIPPQMVSRAAEIDALRGAIRAVEDAFREAAAAAGMKITGDGRVGEADAAQLLGIANESLADRRKTGRGPTSFPLPVGRARISYRLQDLASWVESRRASE